MSNAKPPKTLTSEEQTKILEFLQVQSPGSKAIRKSYRNYLMACLMLDAGLRVGEVVQLLVSHLMFNGKPVHTLVLTSDITKNKKERTVPINSRLSSAIWEFFRHGWSSSVLLPTYHIFAAPQSHVCITTRQVENIIGKASMRSIGRPITPHALRHTWASSLLRITNIRTVQALLGHTCITSTQIYTHPNEDDKKKAIDALEHEVNELGRDLEDLTSLH